MADFNLGILSQLEIDSSSSKKKIEETIAQIEKNLKKVRVELEANSTSSSKNALRTSANSVIDALSKGNNLRKLKIELDVNTTKSVANINKALRDIESKYSRSINVDVNARVNPNSFKQANKAVSNNVQSNSPTPEVKIPTSGIKQAEQGLLDLGRSFRSIEEAENHLAQNLAKGMTFVTQKTENANKELKDYLITVSRVNEAGKKVGSQGYKFSGTQDGGINLTEIKTADTLNKANQQTQADITKEINKQVEAINKANSQGKISYNQAQALLNEYKQIGQLTDKVAFDSANTSSKDKLAGYKEQNNLLRIQENLINDIERAERRMSDSINKRQTGALKSQLAGLNLNNEGQKFDKNAAYQMEQIRTQFRGIKAEAERATRSQLGFVDSFRQAMLKFPVWMGASTLFFGAIQSGKMFIDTITEIDSKMITLAKVMDSGTDLEAVFNSANDAALQFGQTISGALDVYAEFARQGTKGSELPQFANAALIAANVGEIDAKQASEYLTSMSAQWETNGQDAMRQVDSLNEISNNYATTVEKLAQGQAKAGSTAKAMGLSFDETNAVIGTLTAKTKQSGDEIGNFMKAVLPKLYNGKGKSTIEGLGIDMKDQNGELKTAMQLLDEVAQKTKNMDKDQRAAVINGIGGVYHYQRMQVLLDDLGKADSMYKSIKDTSENSSGSALTENAKYMESVEAKINRAKVSIEQFAVALGDAFLKAGVLDGIRIFTDLLTGLTQSVSNLGTAAPIFGIVGAAVALFSKNVRTGFKDASISLADFMVEANNLNKVKNDLGETTHIVPTGASSKLQFDSSGNYDKQASQAKSASMATFELSKAQKEVSTSSIISSGALGKSSAAATGTTVAMNGAKFAATGLMASLRGLLAATGVGIAIAGISFVLEKIVNSMNKASEATEKFKQQQEQTQQAFGSLGGQEIDKLITQYDTLKSKLNQGKSFNTQEASDYKNAVSQLSNVFPDLVSTEGKYGTTLNGNATLMKQRITDLKEQAKAEAELNKIKQLNNIQEQLDTAREASKAPNSRMNWSLQNAQQKVQGAVTGSESQKPLDDKIKKIKDLQTAQEALKQSNKMISDAARAGNESEIAVIKRKQDAINSYMSNIGVAEAAVRSAMGALQNKFLIDAEQINNKNYKLGESGKAAFGAISSAITSTTKNIDTAETRLNTMMSSLAQDKGFVANMQRYEQAIAQFKKQADAGLDTSGSMAQIQTYYSKIAQTMLQLAETMNLPKAAMAEMRSSLEQTVESETGLDATVSRSGEVHLKAASAIKTKTKNTVDNTLANNENAESIENQNSANEELANSMRSIADKYKLVGTALGEMEAGDLSWETRADLVDAYGVKILELGNDEQALTDYIIAQRNKDLKNFEDTTNAKLATSDAYYQSVAKQGSALTNHMLETYGIDASNYNSFEQLKAGITDVYNNGTAAEQEKLINGIAEMYGIDLSNYGTLAEKKDAVETAVLNALGDKWAEHINELSRIANEAFSEFDAAMATLERQEAAYNKKKKKGEYSPLINYNLGKSSIGKLQQVGQNTLNDMAKYNPTYGADIGALVAGEIAKNDKVFRQAQNSAKGLGSVLDGMSDSLGDVGQKAHDTAAGLDGTGSSGGKAGKGLKKAGDEADKTAKEMKKAGVEVELLYKTFTKTTYVADTLSLAMDRLNNKLEKQQLTTQKYATWSEKYRSSLREENKLIDQKTKNLNAQMKSLEAQIKSGNIKEYGLINSEINVPYYKYTAQNLSEDNPTGTVSAKGNSTQARVWNYLMRKGLTATQTAGIMGNIAQESGFKASAEQMSGAYNGGKGLVQWDGARRNQLYAFAKARGKSWKDVNTQLEFLWKELTTTEAGALAALRKTKTATQAAQVFQTRFERAGIPNQAKRNQEANKYYKMYGHTPSVSVSTAVKGTVGSSVVGYSGAHLNKDPWGSYAGGAFSGAKHYGRDISGYGIQGKPIKAARAGVVTFNGWTGGGHTLSIFDGENTYTYMHMLGRSPLKVNSFVKAGQEVGKVGNSFDASKGGRSTGAHLHVQVNRGKTNTGTFKDTFTGANAAIDPVKYGYLNVAGSNYTKAGSPITGSMSSLEVDYANAAEEQRLADIEAAIKASNDAEAMKQKVDEARGRLMDMQLENLQNSRAKEENLYKIAQSHVEQYDYLRKLQANKTAKLEYELNKVEFERGRDSSAWRKKNAQVQTSRNLEKGFEEGKIKYINSAIASKYTKKLFASNTVYGDELRQAKADAQQAIRDIQDQVRQGSAEIAASMFDQIMNDFAEYQGSYERRIKSLSDKKSKLDMANPAEAEQSIKYSQQQVKLENDYAKQLGFTVKQLSIQYKASVKNNDLRKKIKEQIIALKSAIDEAKLAAHNFNIEAANIDIDNQLAKNAERFKKAQMRYQRATYKSSFINQEGQIDLYRENQVDQLKGLMEQRRALLTNKRELQEQLSIYKSLPSHAKRLREEIDNIDNSIKESNKSIHQVRLDLSSGVIQSIKTIYQKQLEVATKAYDDEYKAYEKMINKKLKLIDDQASDEQYKKDVDEKTKEINRLKNEIAQRSGDDSLANQAKIKDLQEQLRVQEEDYNTYLTNKSREDRKAALQQELEDKGTQIEQQKEDLNKGYQDLLEDTRKFNQIQEQLMEGQISKYKTLVQDLAKYVNLHMQDIGRSASQNILDALNESFGGLQELTGQLKTADKLAPVLNSDLKPTALSKVSTEAIKAVNSLSPTSLTGLTSTISAKLPTSVKPATSTTTNNNLNSSALITIQNFNGTPAEMDSLTSTLEAELRKKGFTFN